MSRLLRRREFVTDEWLRLTETPPDEGAAVIVPFATFRENRDYWLSRPARLGILISPAERIEEIAADLPNISLVAVQFTGPGEGRGYTTAKLLRRRYSFTGEIRAVGHVKQDQLYLMARCGIDTFELAPTEKPDEALATLDRFKVAYTPGDPIPAPLRQRFHRRAR
jgi:uncharacterized protein (DUF934 family)